MKHVVAAHGKKELGTFIDFSHKLYKNDPNYNPELFIAQEDMLSLGKHPFHEYSAFQLFLAYNGRRVTGRTAAIRNLKGRELIIMTGPVNFSTTVKRGCLFTFGILRIMALGIIDGYLINNAIEQIKGIAYREYRIFEKAI